MIKPDIVLQNLVYGKSIHSGKQLKNLLGLEDYKFVWVRKVLNVSIPIFIIIYNSRFPNLYLPTQKVMKLKAFGIHKTKKIINQELQGFILSLPVLLDNYKKKILSGSIIIYNDIAGEYFQTKN